MDKIVRWEAKGVGSDTTRYALRTAPRGKGIEIGAYSSWNNALAEEATALIAKRIEEKAIEQGFILEEETWNDLAD